MKRALVAVLALLAGCGGAADGEQRVLTIVVNAPFSRTPFVGNTSAQGAELAVAELNAAGGVRGAGHRYTFRIVRRDNALSSRAAVRNVRRAADSDAVAVVDEGTGVDSSWRVARDADLPICIVYQGGLGLVDPETRPNVFRIAPTDRGISFRLAEYLVPKGYRIALFTDDSGYGREGSEALGRAFERNPEAVATRATLPTQIADVAPQVLRARRAGATALLVWGQASTVARVLTAARASGWDVPVYTPPTGADPVVRQALADHPDWVDGLTFAAGRLTAEVGPEPWYAFAGKYEHAYGADDVGVKTHAGEVVTAPPEYGMYSYDFVHVLAQAIRDVGAEDRAALLAQLEQVSVQGANGDERGFNERSHEGVVDDDVYFATFQDMTFSPVQDDPLSSTLPKIGQVR